MKVYIQTLAMIFILAGIFSCTDERKTLFNEVMDIHDTCMPEMSTLNRIKRNIRKAEISEENPLKSKSFQIIEQIEAADEGMMTWMRDFKVPKKSDPNSEVIPYLKAEKVKIQKVSDDMYRAIKVGNKFLSEIENK